MTKQKQEIMKETIKEFEDLIERYATYTDNKMMVNKLTEIKNKFKEHEQAQEIY